MKSSFLSLGCAAIAIVTYGALAAAAEDSPPPVSATFLSKHSGKPPSKSIRGALVLTNHNKAPLWFVLPYGCDEPPKLDGPLLIPKGFQPTWISADGFNTGAFKNQTAKGSQGKTIRLTVLFVTENKAFCLFRLPPGGRVEFKCYEFGMWFEYVRSFKVWTASEIKVNGKTNLEDWLPYTTLSDAQTIVPKNARPDNLNFDYATLLGHRTDFRKDPITQLDMKLTGTWDIPFDGFK